MNDTIRSIVGMLEADQADLRVAAVQVLGELGVKDAAVIKGLNSALESGDGFLDRYILTALAKIGSSAAVRTLVAQLEESGPHTDLAGHLLGQAGAPARKAIADAYDDASIDARRRMLGILQRQPCRESVAVLEKALATPGLAEAAATGLRACIHELPDQSAKAMADRLNAIAEDETSDAAAAAQALEVLAELDATGRRATFVKCAAPGRAPIVRRAALDALREIRLTPNQLASLVEHLVEDDAHHVVEATTRLLADVDSFPDKAHGTLIELLDRDLPALQEFAVRALARVDSEEVAVRLLPLLHSERTALRNAAAVALATNAAALEPLVKALRNEKERARAERIAGPVAAQAENIDGKTLAGMVDRGLKLLLTQDAVGEVILLTLLRARGVDVADLIVDKAVRLRRAKKLEDATLLLMFVAQTGQLSSVGRYQLALTRLLLDAAIQPEPTPGNSAKAYTPSESGDATMGYFAVLVREGFEVFERLTKESMVSPEMLLRVAEHFSDGVGNDRRFGTDLLQHIAQKHGKKRVGEEARTLLRSASL